MRLKEDQYAHDIRENSADISCWDCARSWDLSLRWSSGFIQKSCTITKWKLCRTADLWSEHYLLSDPKASLSSSRYSCCSHHFFCSDGNWIGVLYPGSCLTSAVRKVPWGCLWKNATGIVWWLSSWCSSSCEKTLSIGAAPLPHFHCWTLPAQLCMSQSTKWSIFIWYKAVIFRNQLIYILLL